MIGRNDCEGKSAEGAQEESFSGRLGLFSMVCGGRRPAQHCQRSCRLSSQDPPATEDNPTKQREKDEKDQCDGKGDVEGGEQLFPLGLEPNDGININAQCYHDTCDEDGNFAGNLTT